MLKPVVADLSVLGCLVEEVHRERRPRSRTFLTTLQGAEAAVVSAAHVTRIPAVFVRQTRKTVVVR
jgi:hypothetical protein